MHIRKHYFVDTSSVELGRELNSVVNISSRNIRQHFIKVRNKMLCVKAFSRFSKHIKLFQAHLLERTESSLAPLNFIRRSTRSIFHDLEVRSERISRSLSAREINQSGNYGGKPPVLNVTSLFMAVGINSTRQ